MFGLDKERRKIRSNLRESTEAVPEGESRKVREQHHCWLCLAGNDVPMGQMRQRHCGKGEKGGKKWF